MSRHQIYCPKHHLKMYHRRLHRIPCPLCLLEARKKLIRRFIIRFGPIILAMVLAGIVGAVMAPF